MPPIRSISSAVRLRIWCPPMARIRSIKPEFFEDDKLANLAAHDRLLFIGLWLLADKNGVLEDRPEWIKAKVFPYEHGESTDVSKMLPRLVSGRYLIRYSAAGRDLIAVRNFSKHQRITGKEAQSDGKYPVPSKEDEAGNGGEAPENHPDVQEQGREGNREQEREQGTGNLPEKPPKPVDPAIQKDLLKILHPSPPSPARKDTEVINADRWWMSLPESQQSWLAEAIHISQDGKEGWERDVLSIQKMMSEFGFDRVIHAAKGMKVHGKPPFATKVRDALKGKA